MDDRDYARLLSGRDEPSILDKEAVLERVLARTARPARARGLIPLALAAAVASTAFVLVLGGNRSRDDSEFTARGTAGPAFDVVCTATGDIGRCPAGETIAFDVRASSKESYAALFARAADGTIVWFLPREGDRSEAVPKDRTSLLDRGVRLDDALPPGRHEVVLVLTREPLDRPALKARLGDGLKDSEGLRVVRRALVVEERR